MALKGAEKSSDDNPSKISALVSGVLNLWLSVLLLGGAIIGCITSQFVKIFGLEPACSYIGCTKRHCCGLEAYRRHVKDECCGDCCFSESYRKYDNAHSVNQTGFDTPISTACIDLGPSQFLRPGHTETNDHPSYFDALGAQNKDETGGLSRQMWHDSDDACFTCSICNALLSFQRHRVVRRKGTGAFGDACDQICWNVTDDTGENVATNSCGVQGEGILIGHLGNSTRLDANNSDTDSSQILPRTAKQRKRRSLTCSNPPRDGNGENISDSKYSSRRIDIEDAWGNVEERSGEVVGKDRKESLIPCLEEAQQVTCQPSECISDKRGIHSMSETGKEMHAGVEQLAVQKKDQQQDSSTLVSRNMESFQAKFRKQEKIGDAVEREDLQEKREGGGQEPSSPGKKNQQKKSTRVCSKGMSLQHSANKRLLWEQMTEMGTVPLEDHSDTAQHEEEDSYLRERDGQGGVDDLQQALRVAQNALSSLYEELEEERNAAAIAANEAMAMISRLQEEKAALQMDSAHYRRLVEEKAIYDQQAMTILKEILFNREKDKYTLEQEVVFCREKYLLEKPERTKRLSMDIQKDDFHAERKEPVLFVEGTEEKLSPTRHQNEPCGERDPDNVDKEWENASADEIHNKRFRGLFLNDTETKQNLYSSRWKQLNRSKFPLADSLHETDERQTGFRESLNDVSLGSHCEEHMLEYLGRFSSSLKDEVAQFVLERLWALEKQFVELVEKKELHFLKPGSLDQTSGSNATWSRDPIPKEQLDGSSSDIISCIQIRPSVIAGEEGSGLQMAVSCGSHTIMPCDGSFITGFSDALPTEEPQQHDDVSSHGDGLLPVHDIYEVQHELNHARQHLFEREGEENTEDRAREPDSLSAGLSQRSLLDDRFSKNQSVGTTAKARRSLSSQDWTSCKLIDKGEPENWNGKAMQYPISDLPLDFQTTSMIFRDKRQMISQEQAESLNKKLKVLECDREILKHTLSLGPLQKKDSGADLRQELLQCLQH